MTGSPKRENIQGRRRPVAFRLAGLLLLLSIAGCISLPILGPTLLLVRADRQAREGAWEEAVASYDEYLSRFPADSAAPRVLELVRTTRPWDVFEYADLSDPVPPLSLAAGSLRRRVSRS